MATKPAPNRGEAPFPEGGLFELGPDGIPVQQGEQAAPVVITVPKAPMPAGGYPLTVYFHGSGGLAAQAVDRGTVTTIGGQPEKGKGPSHELAAYGFASAASALPVNPERLAGAGELAYINFDNPKAFPSTFRQGVFEQRMQEALGLAGLDGLVGYPVSLNLESEGGAPFTGIVVQFEGDGIYDPHAIAFQLGAVKHQYGCFLSTFVETGEAVVVAPGAPGDPCD